MHYTIEKIIDGDSRIISYYAEANQKWEKILSTYDPSDPKNIDEIAREVFVHQGQFERDCGGRTLGQEIMVVSGLGRFYSSQTGFEGNEEAVKNVYTAILGSQCSIEVHGYAENFARAYDLE